MNHSEDTSNTDEPRRCPECTEDLPVRIEFPALGDHDACTETSSVTATHFEQAELFGPSMYPSTQSVSDAEDVGVPGINKEPPVRTDGRGNMGTSVEEKKDRQLTINLDDKYIQFDMDRLANKSAVVGEIPPSPAAHTTAESRERGSWISNFLSLPSRPRDLGAGENDNGHIRITSEAQEYSGYPRPSGPGAFRISGFGITFGDHDEPWQRPHEDLSSDNSGLAEEEVSLDLSGLAQAWLVKEPESMAVPCQDTTSKQEDAATAIEQRRRNFFLLGIVAIATTIVAACVTVPLLYTNDPNKSKHMQIKSTIMDAFGEDYFDSSPKERALHWIVYDDPRNSLGVEELGQPTNLIQRFSLASIYFQTSSQEPWAYCNPPSSTQSDTCVFRDEIYYPKGTTGTRWLTAAHECQWRGVTCAGRAKQVTKIGIWGNNMTGTIPANEIAMLTQLKVLDWTANNLTGSLPSEMFEGISLAGIFLSRNKLTGSIPFQAFLLPKITNIGFSDNLLTGSIPTEVGLFQGAQLGLSGNMLTGSIPEEVYAASNADHLSLSYNLLTGTLSSSVGALLGLLILNIARNPLYGSIPSQIGLLPKLQGLTLEQTNINGTIPEELYQNKELTNVVLGGCNLTGTISTRIGQLKRLRDFQVPNNNFHGMIPKELTGVTNLCTLTVQGNSELTGSIPDYLCSRLFQGCNVMADCTPRESNGGPAVFCPKGCCSTCCDAETEICRDQLGPSS